MPYTGAMLEVQAAASRLPYQVSSHTDLAGLLATGSNHQRDGISQEPVGRAAAEWEGVRHPTILNHPRTACSMQSTTLARPDLLVARPSAIHGQAWS
jgi:hypothetical protein